MTHDPDRNVMMAIDAPQGGEYFTKVTNAYACKVDDQVLLFTVFDTERGAKVNGLVRLFNVIPTDAWDDERINSTWFDACVYGKRNAGKDVSVVPVRVSEV